MLLRETIDYLDGHQTELSDRLRAWLMKSAQKDKCVYTLNDIDFMIELDNMIEHDDVFDWILDNQHSFRLTTMKQPTIMVPNPKQCLHWQRATNTSGTPWNSSKVYIHDIIWTLMHGFTRSTIKRSCGDIRCCNPEHLGEMRDFLKIMEKKPVGRPPGSRNKTDDQC